MADTIVKLYADGTGDFTNLRTLLNSQFSDRVSIESALVILVKGHIIDTSTTNKPDLAAYTTSADYNIVIKAELGEETDGVIANDTTSISNPNQYLIAARGEFLEFRDIAIRSCLYGIITPDNTSMYNCSITEVRSGGFSRGYFENCVFFNCGTVGGDGTTGATITGGNYHQCSIVVDDTHGGSSGQIVVRNTTTSLTQCIVHNETIGGYGNYRDVNTAGCDWNADSENLAAGTNPQFVTTADFVDYVGGNFSIDSDSTLYTVANGGRVGAFLSGVSSTVITLDIVTNVTGADFVILKAGTDEVLDSIDQEPTTTYSFEYTQDEPIDIGIIKQGYEVMYFYGYTSLREDTTLYFNLRYDRNYF